MTDPISKAERLRRALKWEKAVIAVSFWFCVILFLVPGVLLGHFVAPAVFDTTSAEVSVLVRLSVGAFIGLVCLGTILIAGNLLCRFGIEAVRAKTRSG
jgi:hypothetical protein